MDDCCKFPNGVSFKPDGRFELDSPCHFKDTERYKNVTVIISECRKCGRISISWERQENTEQVEVE